VFTNLQIAQILKEMSAYYAMQRIDFKERAYDLAAADVLIYPEPLAEVYKNEGLKGLTKVPNVGNRIAKHIEELLKTGHFQEYEDFRKRIPVNLPELLQLEGIGPRTIYDLFLHLGVRNLADLEKACREHKVRTLRGFGAKSEARIREAIQDYNTRNNE
jgi:DNA polymerase (family X)